MGGCGVCVYGSDVSECIGYRCVLVKAGQPWHCSECNEAIPKGHRYELASWFYADKGGYGNAKTCLICAEIADAFMCGGRYHGECFWEGMEASFHKLTTSCFDKLKTPEAKAELRRRWMAWKGITA